MLEENYYYYYFFSFYITKLNIVGTFELYKPRDWVIDPWHLPLSNLVVATFDPTIFNLFDNVSQLKFSFSSLKHKETKIYIIIELNKLIPTFTILPK